MEAYVRKLRHMIAEKTAAHVSEDLIHDIRCTLADHGNEAAAYWQARAAHYEELYNVELMKGLRKTI